jgi:hypothetical protein
MNKVIPIILCIDLEPDIRMLDPKKPLPWKGYEQTYELFRSLRSKIMHSTGSPVHFSWFFRMDPQVAQVYGSATWPVTQYPKIIEDLRTQGDELGLHVHLYRWDQALNNWVIDHGNPLWVEHCIRSSLSAFRQTFGKKCQAFRFGDAWISNEAVSLLEKSGVCFDLTLEPGQEGYHGLKKGEIYTGYIPDLRKVPQTPYVPLTTNFKEPDPDRRAGIWMIPVSRGEIFGISALAFKTFRRWVNGVRVKRAWVTLYLFQEPRLFRKVLDQLLRSMDNPYLNITLNSLAILNPYFLRNMKINLNYILSHSRVKDFVFSSPQETMTSLKIVSFKDDIGRRA